MTTTSATPVDAARERGLAAAIRDHWAGFLAQNDEPKLLERDHDFSGIVLSPAAARWPDVAPLKVLSDTHLERVHECWKVAAWTKSGWKQGRPPGSGTVPAPPASKIPVLHLELTNTATSSA